MPDAPPLSHAEEREVRERQEPGAVLLHEVIRRQGADELERPAASLLWSGFAAGVIVWTSILAQAAMEARLPDAEWRPLATAPGYALGFVLAILGRLQLFTENTLTAVIPTVAALSARSLLRLARLWALVLAANLAGTLLMAALVRLGLVALPDQYPAALAVARRAMDHSAFEMMTAAVPAGLLIAGVAWVLPMARGQAFWVVLLPTLFIAAGGWTHVVAGSGEAWLLVLAGERAPGWMLTGFLAPALAGNIAGGTVLFALLAHAQARPET